MATEQLFKDIALAFERANLPIPLGMSRDPERFLAKFLDLSPEELDMAQRVEERIQEEARAQAMKEALDENRGNEESPKQDRDDEQRLMEELVRRQNDPEGYEKSIEPESYPEFVAEEMAKVAKAEPKAKSKAKPKAKPEAKPEAKPKAEPEPTDRPTGVPDYFLATGDMRRTGVGVPDSPLGVDVSNAPKAEVISEDPEDYTGKAIEIFEDLHGSEFNPKSSDDVGKLEKMKSMIAYEGGIGDSQADINKFALQFYRNS